MSGGWVMRGWELTTSVRKHRVLAGARGSRAACRSHTLILLHTHTNILKHIRQWTKILQS